MALDYMALRAEVTTDPAALGYAGKSRGQVADLLNAPSPRWTRPAPLVPIVSVLQWAATGPLATITAGQSAMTAAGGVPAATVQAICLAAIHLLGAATSFDLAAGSPNLVLIQTLVTAGILTPVQQTSLLALATIPASRAESLFGAGTFLTLDDIYRVI